MTRLRTVARPTTRTTRTGRLAAHAAPEVALEQAPRSVRLRIDLAYDGSGFSGWAAQPGRRTVEETLAAAFGRVLRLPGPPGLTVAGRTDAGVHARGQVVHVDVPESAWTTLVGHGAGQGHGKAGPLTRLAACSRPTSACTPSAPRRTASTRGSPRCGAATPTASATTRPAPTLAPARDALDPRGWYLAAMNEAAASLRASTTSPPSAAAARARPPSGPCARCTGTATPTTPAAPMIGPMIDGAWRSRPWSPTRSATTWCGPWSARCSPSARGAGGPAGPPRCSRPPSVTPPSGSSRRTGCAWKRSATRNQKSWPHGPPRPGTAGPLLLPGQHPGAEVDVGAAGDQAGRELLELPAAGPDVDGDFRLVNSAHIKIR